MTRNQAGFSLIEVALAVAVISFALVAILGLMPVGLKSAAEAGDATRTSMLEANAEADIRATVSPTDFTSATARTVTRYYDQQGILLTSATGAFYRVDATIGNTWTTPLANVDEAYLRPVSAVFAGQLTRAVIQQAATRRALHFTSPSRDRFKTQRFQPDRANGVDRDTPLHHADFHVRDEFCERDLDCWRSTSINFSGWPCHTRCDWPGTHARSNVS